MRERLAITASLWLLPVLAWGHHSWARYDGDNIFQISGTITSVEWASPHVFMYFDVTEDDGSVTAWTMELDPPTLLRRYGLRHDSIQAGMAVTITGVRAVSGAPMMRGVRIELRRRDCASRLIARMSASVGMSISASPQKRGPQKRGQTPFCEMGPAKWGLTPFLSLLLLATLLAAGAGRAQAPPPAAFPGVAPPAPPAAILLFQAETEAMDQGTSLKLRWEAINAYAVTIRPDIGAVATFGTIRIAPERPTQYTLEVTGADGITSETVTVDPVPGAERFVTTQNGTRQLQRHADGTIDLSGVFIGGRGIRMQAGVALTPAAEARAAQEAGTQNDLGSGITCLPPGVPSATMMPFPLQIVHKPDLVVILYEAYHLFRIIPIGRDHPDYLDPTWMGYSVAHWEDDTLVVEVRGFNDRGRAAGNRHTTDMFVTERYTRLSPDIIRYEAAIEDPTVFAEPVRYAGNLEARPEWEIGEYVCAENNKDYETLFQVSE